jgi:hypothetical protein
VEEGSWREHPAAMNAAVRGSTSRILSSSYVTIVEPVDAYGTGVMT